jgi:hypothetical protein
MRRAVLAGCLTVLLAAPAADGTPLRAEAGLFGGVLRLDGRLRDYRWDAAARPVWGARAAAGSDRSFLGLRCWRASTTQGTGIPGIEGPAVTLTGIDLALEVLLAEAAGFGLSGIAGGGALLIRYAPERLVLAGPAGESFEVRFDGTIHPTATAGIVLRRSLLPGAALALSLERSYLRMETAHRDGGVIRRGDETFGNWSARLGLDMGRQ